ncbi:golgin subfamily A member 2 isoform X5 [Eucyclogobius newberryi]|uniref:golgin subfamily A member 2 isoform X5 n=1 Tax=Eucyclogobius newberryi TaxID=166745 RepID=UPI003B5BC1AE
MADQSRQIKLAAAKKKLKEFQQKGSPASTGGEKGAVVVGAKKKRKVKVNQLDLSSEGRSSPDNVNTYTDANGNGGLSEELRPLSSTESLRQLSQQLNGLVSGSSTTYVNGDVTPSVGERELETQQSQDFSDQLQKERKEFEQKFAKEHSGMREQLQVHIQTIGILVSEKSELQTALQYTQQAARHKSAEAEEFNSRLQSTKQRVSELERTLSTVSTQQKILEKHNKELEKERNNLRLEVLRINNASEESKQQSSEMSEQIKIITQENASMKLELQDLHKRLELADLMLQQCSSQSDPASANQQVQVILEEKQQLESQNHQLMESVSQLKTERDRYVEQIQEEGYMWKDKTEQLLTQVALVAEERDMNISRVDELEASISKLKESITSLSQEKETRNEINSESSGPSEREVALEEALNNIQQQNEALNAQCQAQLRDNEQLSRLCAEKEARLGELERQVESQTQEAEDRRRMLEDVQSDKATISRALTQNRTLKDQLAEMQNGFVKLTNENLELTTAIQSEQHVKKELARRMGEIQEELHNVKEQLEEKGKDVQGVLEQREQLVAHLQQYSAGYQALASEREQLHSQYLQQCQLMGRLQHDESQGRVQLELSHVQLKEAQDHLEQLVRDNEQLKAEVTELLNSSALATPPRVQGDGIESQEPEESQHMSSSIVIPEDFESQKDMEDFIRGAIAQVEAERDEARRRLEDEHRLHMAARHQASLALSREHHTHKSDSQEEHSHCQHSHDDAEGGVPVEVHQALQAAMDKLQQRFTSLMQEKADLKERVEELEHRCIQLSGETDTIGEYIALYQNQRAIMKQKHQEKEQYISMLAQDKEEMKAKLAELQDLVMRLVAERNEWYSRYNSAVSGKVNPDLLPLGQRHVHSEDHFHTQTELDAVSGEEAMEVVPLSEPSTAVEGPPSQTLAPGPSQTESKPLVPNEDGTAQQIMQLLHEIQNPQGGPRAPPFLGENPCIPFFYRPDEQDEVKILVV